MPKRTNRFCLDASGTLLKNKLKQKTGAKEKPGGTKVRKNAEETTNESLDEDFELENENELTSDNNNKPKHMRAMRYNQNNEIERLLMHSTMKIIQSVDHSEFPSFNQGLWPQANQDSLTAYPSCGFSIPRPIYSTKCQCQKIDLCYKRPLFRDGFRKRNALTRAMHLKFLESKKHRDAEKNGIFHRSIFDFADRIHTQPDTYFHGSYDYYYTGGNLCSLAQSGNIVHANGERLQRLEMSEFPTIDHYPATNYLSSISNLKTTEDSEIFEIKPMVTSQDILQRNCFIARQRNVISLNCLNDERQLKVITQFRSKSTPFISFAQSGRNHNRLLITTMKQHIRLYDLGNNVPSLVKLYEIEPNGPSVSWNIIRPWRENTYLYANEYKFSFVDTRTTPDQWMESAVPVIGNNFICDHISSVAPSGFNNLFYVGTNHRLHCLDVRQIKINSFNDPNAVVCRWSHQLQYAPLMIDTCRIGNTEYIAMSSPVAGDLHVCQLNREKNNNDFTIKETQRVPKHVYKSPCLPYQPPTALEALEIAASSGKCLQPEARLQERLHACTTGMVFTKPNEFENDFALGLLLTSNSLGDIFAHTLTKREADEADCRGNARSSENLNDFANKLSHVKHTLQYTDIKDFKVLRKVFLCKYLNPELKYDLDAMDDSYSETEFPPSANIIPIPAKQVKKKRKRLHMGRWQKSFATLRSYKDALVSDLLSIWDVEMDEGDKIKNLDDLPTNLNVTTDCALKVQDWLNTNNNKNHPMIRLPLNIASQYTEQDSVEKETSTEVVQPSTSKDIENNNLFPDHDINLTQMSMDFENAIQSTQVLENTIQFDTTADETQLYNTTTTSLNKSTAKKKTKRYVKGF